MREGKGLLFFLLFFICFHFAYSQVDVVADSRLQTILEQHSAYNEAAKTIRGYRIKVATFTGQGAKNNAYAIKDKLEILYPSERTYVTFDEPHFIVRHGDYLTRLEAHKIFNEIKIMYPTAIITPDLINLPPLSEEDLKQPEYYEPEEEDNSN